MRIALIGPGDIEFHYQKILGINSKKLFSELEKIAQTLVESNVELELLPDRGVSLEIAKFYKEKKGKKVIGTLPKSDKTFGIAHLEPYRDIQINNKSLFDEEIDTGDWFKHDLIKGLMGQKLFYLGSSPGTNGELNYAIYLYKLIKGFKEDISTSAKKIHSSIQADENFEIIVYSPFLLNKKISRENEAYLEKFGIKLSYVNNCDELKSRLNQ